MTEEEFNKQYDAAQHVGEFSSIVDGFVVDDKSALAALQTLHERIQTLTSDYNCPKHLYFLSEDLCDLLNETHENYSKGGGLIDDLEFKDDEEITSRTSTL